MVSFENIVKSMPLSLLELKVIPSFCFAFKIPDNVTATNRHLTVVYNLFFFSISFPESDHKYSKKIINRFLFSHRNLDLD